MIKYLTYKEIRDEKTGKVRAFELKEIDNYESNAQKFSKLYNLQAINKKTTNYRYVAFKVI